MNITNALDILDGVYDKGVEALAIAITRQAAEDYEDALIESKDIGRPTPKLKRLDAFWKSSWGQLVSFGQAENIRQKIRNGMGVDREMRSKLTKAECEWIRSHYVKDSSDFNLRCLGRRFGVSHGTIIKILKGEYTYAEERKERKERESKSV